MTSQRPYHYFGLLDDIVEGDGRVEVRPNTVVTSAVTPHGTVVFVVSLYDEPLCELHTDGSVVIGEPMMTNTTKNRLNDVLIPLGYKIRSFNHRWMIVNMVEGGTFKPYKSGLVLGPVVGSEVARLLTAH